MHTCTLCVLWDRNNQFELLILLVGERHVVCMESGGGRRGHSRKQELSLSRRDHLGRGMGGGGEGGLE